MPVRLSDTLKKLLLAYVAVFIVQHIIDQFMGGNFAGWFALTPIDFFHGKIWTLFTYGFLHSDIMPLVLNCLVLAFIGGELEAIWGKKKFLTYYFFCSIMVGVFYLFLQLLPVALPPLMGASGGVYGVLMAYGILFPERELLFMMLFPMQAKQFVWVLAGIEFLQAVFSGGGSGTMVAAVAHLSGMGVGFLYLWAMAKGIRIRKGNAAKIGSTKRNASHLRLVPGTEDDEPKRGGPKTWH